MHRILLIDDHAIVREGFRRLLEEADGFEVVAEAGTPTEALAAARRHSPDLALVDLSLGTESSGLVLLMQLHETFPKMRCVVLSMHDDPGLVVRALEGSAAAHGGTLVPGCAEIDLVIGPGFAPRVVHALLTGVHDPSESHFALLSAFASADVLARATAHAEAAGYLCHEFGDAMLIAA